jgi:hypothetical protein
MTHYQRWRDGWLLVAACGTGFAILVSPWAGIALFLAFASASFATTLFMRQPPRRGRERPWAAAIRWRSAAGQAGGIGLCAVGFVMLSATMPALTSGVVLLVVLTSPTVWRAFRAVAPPADDPLPIESRLPLPRRPSEVVVAPKPTSLTSMSDDELAVAWRRSHVTLAHARSTAFRLATVSLRAAYLDELERRDPQGFQWWLASGARAPGSPRRYLGDEPPRGKSDAS